MVIDKAINHSFRSRELYWPLQALRVVLINVKPDVNVTAEAPRRHNSFLPRRIARVLTTMMTRLWGDTYIAGDSICWFSRSR